MEEWIDEQRAVGELSDSSIRHNMNLLSRFFSWAIARGKASINPVQLIPMGSLPTQTVKSDTPWLEDEAIARKLIARGDYYAKCGARRFVEQQCSL